MSKISAQFMTKALGTTAIAAAVGLHVLWNDAPEGLVVEGAHENTAGTEHLTHEIQIVRLGSETRCYDYTMPSPDMVVATPKCGRGGERILILEKPWQKSDIQLKR